MNHQQAQPILPVLLLLWLWFALDEQTWFKDNVILWSLAFWYTGWIAIRVCSASVHRLGWRAWWLIAQMAVACWLFAAFVQTNGVTMILLLWGVAIPVFLLGSALRKGHDSFEPLRRFFTLAAAVFVLVACGGLLFFWYRAQPTTYSEIITALVTCGFSPVALYYGWRMGAAAPGGQFDARFGTPDSLRYRGMSHER